jgi:hypothetical protein
MSWTTRFEPMEMGCGGRASVLRVGDGGGGGGGGEVGDLGLTQGVLGGFT